MKPIAKELARPFTRRILKPGLQSTFFDLDNEYGDHFRQPLVPLSCVTYELHAATAEESNV